MIMYDSIQFHRLRVRLFGALILAPAVKPRSQRALPPLCSMAPAPRPLTKNPWASLKWEVAPRRSLSSSNPERRTTGWYRYRWVPVGLPNGIHGALHPAGQNSCYGLLPISDSTGQGRSKCRAFNKIIQFEGTWGVFIWSKMNCWVGTEVHFGRLGQRV